MKSVAIFAFAIPLAFAAVLLVAKGAKETDVQDQEIEKTADSVQKINTGVASVIDGDTIEIHSERIRINGIDAPEASQLCRLGGEMYRCGQQAALALSDLLGRKTVSCSKVTTDRWGRTVADCGVSGLNVAEWMVASGWAIAYRRYSMRYVAAEDHARERSVGIWRGDFIAPDEWRAGKRW